jgi:hypothetical protein
MGYGHTKVHKKLPRGTIHQSWWYRILITAIAGLRSRESSKPNLVPNLYNPQRSERIRSQPTYK